jgi:hypothetical protein
MAKDDKTDIRNAKRTSAKVWRNRMSNSKVTAANKASKADVKSGRTDVTSKSTGRPIGVRVTSSGIKAAKTNSATKPSMPVKTGAKNKMKAQGAKSMGAPTSGYGKTTKKK